MSDSNLIPPLSLSQEFEIRKMMDAAKGASKEQLIQLLESCTRQIFLLQNALREAYKGELKL